MSQLNDKARFQFSSLHISHPRLDACILSVIAILTLAIPLHVIRPFVPQDASMLSFALAVRDLAFPLSAACALGIAAILILTWRNLRWATRTLIAIAFVLAALSATADRINIFEKMFHPYPDPTFVTASTSPIDPDDKVLTITLNNQTHAFPIRTMGYHHIVNDTLAGDPIAATYCTLCHTGIIYSRRLGTGSEARVLYFTLAGINNGNALLRDRETGSIWQQSTGEAIFGPLKGRTLTVLPADELTFALWRTERPNGLILKPETEFAALYDLKDWEAHVAKTHVVLDTTATGIDPHTLMLGILSGPSGNQSEAQSAKAFPIQSILTDRLIEDRLPNQPILILLGPDNVSIRVFSAQLPNQPTSLSFALAAENLITDRQTASTWNFTGCATTGPLTGKCLPQLEAHKDYWFDWHNHHPNTRVFKN